MATVRFEDGIVAHFDVPNPSQNDIEEAHATGLQQRFKNSALQSRAAKIGFPLAGGLGLSLAAGAPTALAGEEIGGAAGAVIGSFIEPGGGTAAGTAIGKFAGGAIGETIPFFLGMIGGQRARQRLVSATTGLPVEPFPQGKELLEDFGSALTFVSGAKGAGMALEATPAFIKSLPILRQFTQPGSVLHTIATNSVGGYLTGGTQGAQLAALLGGTFQGVVNFRTAVKGFPVRTAAIREKLGNQIDELSVQKSQLKQTMESELIASEQQLESRLGLLKQTEKTLTVQRQDEAHRIAQSFRRGGSLHEAVQEYRQERARTAWEPVDQLGREVITPAPLRKLEEVSSRLFGNDTGRNAVAMETLRKALRSVQAKGMEDIPISTTSGRVISDIERQSLLKSISQLPPDLQMQALKEFSESTSHLQVVPDVFTAPQLLDASSTLGQGVRGRVRAGTTRVVRSDLPEIDARHIVAETLSDLAPDHLKDALDLGKAQWKDYATDDELLTHFFSPSASPHASTEHALGLLTDLSEGTASPYLKAFASRLEQGMKISLTKGINPLTQELQSLPIAEQSEKRLSESGKNFLEERVKQKIQALGLSAKEARTIARNQLDILSKRSRQAVYVARLMERAAFWGIFIGGIRAALRDASQ